MKVKEIMREITPQFIFEATLDYILKNDGTEDYVDVIAYSPSQQALKNFKENIKDRIVLIERDIQKVDLEWVQEEREVEIEDFKKELINFRNQLEPHFSASTACPGTVWNVVSSGHCAVVALLTQNKFGGELVSTKINGHSNWFNRIDGYDVDLTGDQFGFDEVQIKPQGTLYNDVKIRTIDEVNEETFERAELLAEKAGIKYKRI